MRRALTTALEESDLPTGGRGASEAAPGAARYLMARLRDEGLL